MSEFGILAGNLKKNQKQNLKHGGNGGINLRERRKAKAFWGSWEIETASRDSMSMARKPLKTPFSPFLRSLLFLRSLRVSGLAFGFCGKDFMSESLDGVGIAAAIRSQGAQEQYYRAINRRL